MAENAPTEDANDRPPAGFHASPSDPAAQSLLSGVERLKAVLSINLGDKLSTGLVDSGATLARIIRDEHVEAIEEARKTAEAFINKHGFPYRDPENLRSTLSELLDGIRTVDANYCEAIASDFQRTAGAVMAIEGLPPAIVQRQLANAYQQLTEQIAAKKRRLLELVDEFHKWAEGLIREAAMTGSEAEKPKVDITTVEVSGKGGLAPSADGVAVSVDEQPSQD